MVHSACRKANSTTTENINNLQIQDILTEHTVETLLRANRMYYNTEKLRLSFPDKHVCFKAHLRILRIFSSKWI